MLSRSWEMVYYAGDEREHGSTDFDEFPTEQKVEFLHHYAEKAKRWFKDPRLDQFPVSDQEVSAALANLKPKPLPKVRRRIDLRTWKYILSSSDEPFCKGSFDDRDWREADVPLLFSPEREKENLRLRRRVEVGDFKIAMLVVESLPDYSRIWVNEQLVRDTTVGITGRSDGRYEPFRIDLTDYLQPNAENLIAIEVLCRTEKYWMSCEWPFTTTCGEVFGVAGDIFLDLTDGRAYIHDPFVRAADVADPCTVKATVTVSDFEISSEPEDGFKGAVQVSIHEWLPEESGEPVAAGAASIAMLPGGSETVELCIQVPSPKLWTPARPCLYVARIVVKDGARELDECVEVFGIRTITAPDNHLYFNGRRFFAKGTHTFNRFLPLDRAKVNMVCPPNEPLMKDLLAFKKMNGMVLRVLPRVRNTNYSRMLDMCDQLGVMLVWPTMALWDYEQIGGIAAYEMVRRLQLPPSIKYVRNHPSIIAWEGCNEPGPVNKALLWEDFYRAVKPLDDSRLIDPISESQGIHGFADTAVRGLGQKELVHGSRDCGGPPGSWQAKEVYWGFHTYHGWYSPFGGIADPTSDPRWFTPPEADRYHRHMRPIIHTELGAEGMPNWPLYQGEPWHKEWGSANSAAEFELERVGRNLDPDAEWEESQAYQALVLQHFITKLRLSDIDGASVCTFADGSQEGRYHKGVLDTYRRAKIGYHTLAMSYQDILASGTGGKVILGSRDTLEPQVVNDGTDVKCSVLVEVRDALGNVVDQKLYEDVILPGAVSVTSLPTFKPALPKAGYYSVEYRVESD